MDEGIAKLGSLLQSFEKIHDRKNVRISVVTIRRRLHEAGLAGRMAATTQLFTAVHKVLGLRFVWKHMSSTRIVLFAKKSLDLQVIEIVSGVYLVNIITHITSLQGSR